MTTTKKTEKTIYRHFFLKTFQYFFLGSPVAYEDPGPGRRAKPPLCPTPQLQQHQARDQTQDTTDPIALSLFTLRGFNLCDSAVLARVSQGYLFPDVCRFSTLYTVSNYTC